MGHKDTHTHTHKHGNRINRQPFPKHNSLFNNYHTLSLGQRGMTDTKADHNIILMSKNSTGWEKAQAVKMCVCVRACAS